MRRMTLLAGLALAVGVLLPVSALPAAGGSDLPLKATQPGTSTTNLATGEIHLVSTGPMSHFGLTTFEQHGHVLPIAPGTFSFNTTWTATAANGDQMFGTFTGTGRFTDAVHSTWQINGVSTGGTGRFTDANFTVVGNVESTRLSLDGVIATASFEATLDGQLSYR